MDVYDRVSREWTHHPFLLVGSLQGYMTRLAHRHAPPALAELRFAVLRASSEFWAFEAAIRRKVGAGGGRLSQDRPVIVLSRAMGEWISTWRTLVKAISKSGEGCHLEGACQLLIDPPWRATLIEGDRSRKSEKRP